LSAGWQNNLMSLEARLLKCQMVGMGMRNNYKIQIFKIVSIETVKSTVGFLAIPKGAEVFGESIGQLK
jgi:hypothetical protein